MDIEKQKQKFISKCEILNSAKSLVDLSNKYLSLKQSLNSYDESIRDTLLCELNSIQKKCRMDILSNIQNHVNPNVMQKPTLSKNLFPIIPKQKISSYAVTNNNLGEQIYIDMILSSITI